MPEFEGYPAPLIDATELPAVLARLQGHVVKRELAVAPRLRPGRTPEDIRAALQSAGMSSHPDLELWWGWHDGVNNESDDYPAGRWGPGHYVEYVYHPSLWEAIERCLGIRAFNEWDEDLQIGGVPDSYVPVLLMRHQVTHLLDTSTGEVAGHLYEYPESDWFRWPNLATVVNALAVALERGDGWPRASTSI